LFAPLKRLAKLSTIGPGAALTAACPYTFALSVAWTRTRGGQIKMNPPRTRTAQPVGDSNHALKPHRMGYLHRRRYRARRCILYRAFNMNDYIDDAIDAAVAVIQDELGQTDGGFAAHHLAGDDYQTLRTILKRYAEAERANLQNA
jgi:hypothetical protein